MGTGGWSTGAWHRSLCWNPPPGRRNTWNSNNKFIHTKLTTRAPFIHEVPERSLHYRILLQRQSQFLGFQKFCRLPGFKGSKIVKGSFGHWNSLCGNSIRHHRQEPALFAVGRGVPEVDVVALDTNHFAVGSKLEAKKDRRVKISLCRQKTGDKKKGTCASCLTRHTVYKLSEEFFY